MAFKCPECGFPGALKITASISLPPDSRSDEIILQIISCEMCRFRGAAVYQESRRGALDSDSWEHTGYWLGDQDLKWLSSLIKSCPARKNQRCDCRAHQLLGAKDESGRWVLPANISWDDSFPMRRA